MVFPGRHRDPFFIRVIREIRGFNCCFSGGTWKEQFNLAKHAKRRK